MAYMTRAMRCSGGYNDDDAYVVCAPEHTSPVVADQYTYNYMISEFDSVAWLGVLIRRRATDRLEDYFRRLNTWRMTYPFANSDLPEIGAVIRYLRAEGNWWATVSTLLDVFIKEHGDLRIGAYVERNSAGAVVEGRRDGVQLDDLLCLYGQYGFTPVIPRYEPKNLRRMKLLGRGFTGKKHRRRKPIGWICVREPDA